MSLDGPGRSPEETPDSHEAFPRLSTDQLDVLEGWGERRSTEAGDVLYRVGEGVGEVFVVLSGRVGIVASDLDGERLIQVHGQGRLLGELGMLQGQPALFGARVVQAGEIVAVPSGQLGDVARQDSVLGETILRAYLIRRSHLIDGGAGTGIVGSCYAPDTRRLLEFATRNRLPHKWIDLEKDPDADAFLHRMNVASKDTPVVVLGRGKLLRNPCNSVLATELGLRTSLTDAAVCDLLVVGAMAARHQREHEPTTAPIPAQERRSGHVHSGQPQRPRRQTQPPPTSSTRLGHPGRGVRRCRAETEAACACLAGAVSRLRS
jgi:thioredoxin reductase (NADPH)